MNIDEIRNMATQDLSMDETELDKESMRTPQIHNKYLIIYTDEKLILGKIQSDLYKLKKYK